MHVIIYSALHDPISLNFTHPTGVCLCVDWLEMTAGQVRRVRLELRPLPAKWLAGMSTGPTFAADLGPAEESRSLAFGRPEVEGGVTASESER